MLLAMCVKQSLRYLFSHLTPLKGLLFISPGSGVGGVCVENLPSLDGFTVRQRKKRDGSQKTDSDKQACVCVHRPASFLWA